MMKWTENKLRLAINAAEVALWSWNVDTNQIKLDKRGCDLWDVSENEAVSFEDLSRRIYPPEQDRVGAAFAATRAIAGRYEIDFRIIARNPVRWISSRGQGSDAAIYRSIMFGVFLDVTGRKQAEEANELLAGETGAFEGRIRVSAPRLGFGETAATDLALVVHELATNSIKYGALSAKAGTLDVSCASDDHENVVVVWTERGGPPVEEPPTTRGYGSRLLNQSMSGLGGSLETNWDAGGVVVTLRMTKAALVA
jgi:anti-sigma regulatory factor (Ser/Thr protein kinase)